MVGYQYYDQQRWGEAIQWFEKSLAINSEYIVALYRKGYAHFKLEQVGEALQAFTRCRSLWYALPENSNKEKDKKNCAKAAYYQAKVLLDNPYKIQGNVLEEAIPLIRESIELTPQNADCHYLLGKVLLEIGQVEEAIGCFQNADKLHPNQDYVLDRWGQALAKLNCLDEAEKIYLRIPPKRRKDYILRNLGGIQFQKKDYQQAIITLQQAIQKNRRNHNGHYCLGSCYQAVGEFGLAVQEYREAIRLKKKYYDGAFPEVQKVLDDLLALHPEAEKMAHQVNQRGKIIKYFDDRGFGFIETNTGDQLFFHIKDCKCKENIEIGMYVEYQQIMSNKGPKAISVRRVKQRGKGHER
jgi:tetratricopeptide (TPR) repeat protein